MRKQIFITVIMVLFFTDISSQTNDYLSDNLTKEFYKGRRDALKSKLPSNSVAVFFSNPVRNRANDVDYIYHQDPDFYYLTGYNEPNSVLFVYSDKQTKNGKQYDEAFYVQKRDPSKEVWTGYRLGVNGTKEQLGIMNTYNGEDFFAADMGLDKLNKIYILGFNDDYRDGKNTADLFDIIKSFKQKVNYDNNIFQREVNDIYETINNSSRENVANVAYIIGKKIEANPNLNENTIIKSFAQAKTNKEKLKIRRQALESIKELQIDQESLANVMAVLREVKTEEEVVLMRKAIEISAVGQVEIMKAMHPNMSEREVQGVHEFVYKKYGAEYEGYPSIVGAGNNGCVLHYIENSKMETNGELILMDLGAEYHGYSADVTRTIPVNGKFSKEQKLIYDLVYRAQEAGILMALEGNTLRDIDFACREVIGKGLVKLGLISNANENRKYFLHFTCHYLGLDVHDRGTYGKLKPNNIITIEPGIYIPKGSDCDEKWWGIAVRIEDDFLITKGVVENLSILAPRKSEDIEAMMRQTSVLSGFVLPELSK
ncbi:MAG: aminopeptidase P N-terminal domain-containing protein [Flavobacteriaceae bacterium]|nr:aminopeptidase P N-terminal domain-containing protein [Flavobacteriaceae bacterium]